MALVEITKKELLQITGISYGQLYRWKRKGLIPEDWFIKKASFTGQETYFPKEQILNRIDQILELKDEKSLEEIAEIINNNEKHEEIEINQIREHDLFIHDILLNELITENNDLKFIDIVILKVIDNVYSIIDNEETVKQLHNFLTSKKDELLEFKGSIYFFTEKKEFGCMLLANEPELSFNLDLVTRLDYTTLVDNLKLILFT
ncbi:DUF4004 family protein [Haloplasma contractile]|uniref:DUF4004 family protein n=1 Tax=Haloplasma contractile SSD-17B TaxID=1033810 RepID=U2EDB6_9MOLU|nr:DUF4004 family protein [Haloplasma contractile]ERJ12993.1 hypothetical protein HLPCO_000592 [Haloplasma contractile SSD-17B]